MTSKIETSIQVFEANFVAAKKAFTLNSSMEACGCAASFIGDTEPVSEAALYNAKKYLKANTGLFSPVGRGNASQVVAALLSKDSNPEYALSQIESIYKGLKKKFSSSDYPVLAATMIYKHIRPENYDYFINRLIQIYKLLHKEHPLITGSEDIVNITLMAMSEYSEQQVADECEKIICALHRPLRSKNDNQYMACVLSVFEGTPEEKASSVLETRQLLKEHGVRFSGSGLSVVAAISSLVKKGDLPAICQEISIVGDRLKQIRGMGSLGAGKTIRNLIAAGIVVDAYCANGDIKVRSAIHSAIVSMIIETEIACVIAASSAAAASAAAASAN